MAFTRLLRNLRPRPGRSARGSCRSSPTRPAPSAWTRCSASSRSTPPHGQLYEPVDADAAALLHRGQGRPDPRGGHHRGRLDGQSFTAAGTALRHPRRADGAVLHLLLDVRLPAGRRPHLGRRRRPGPRLPARRHRRPHHARSARACSTRTATASCSPRPCPTCRGLRPGVRLRDGGHHPRRHRTRMYGAGGPSDVFYYLTLYNENYAMPARCPTGVADDGIVAGLYRWAAAPDGHRGHRATILFSGTAQGAAREAAGRAGRALRRRRRAVERHLATRRCARRRSPPSAGTACTRPRRPRTAARHRAAGRRRRPDRRGHRLHEGRCPTRSPGSCPGRSCRSAPTASVAPTPARRCAASSRSTPPTSWWRCCPRWPPDGEVDPSVGGARRHHTRYGIDPEPPPTPSRAPLASVGRPWPTPTIPITGDARRRRAARRRPARARSSACCSTSRCRWSGRSRARSR